MVLLRRQLLLLSVVVINTYHEGAADVVFTSNEQLKHAVNITALSLAFGTTYPCLGSSGTATSCDTHTDISSWDTSRVTDMRFVEVKGESFTLSFSFLCEWPVRLKHTTVQNITQAPVIMALHPGCYSRACLSSMRIFRNGTLAVLRQ